MTADHCRQTFGMCAFRFTKEYEYFNVFSSEKDRTLEQAARYFARYRKGSCWKGASGPQKDSTRAQQGCDTGTNSESLLKETDKIKSIL